MTTVAAAEPNIPSKHFLEFFLCLVQCGGRIRTPFSGTEVRRRFQHVWGFQRFEESQTLLQRFSAVILLYRAVGI